MADRTNDERLREIVVNGTYCGLDEGHSIAAELLAARAEVERLRDEAANWRNLLPVYEDAEREVQQLRADLREALELLRELGRPDHGDDLDARYVAFLEKHKEMDQ